MNWLSLLAKLKTELGVGLLILGSAGLLVYSSVQVTGFRSDLTDTYEVKAYFENVAGLVEGTAVRIAGIKVGEIKNIDLVEGKAEVVLAIYEKYRLRKSSSASIKSLGVLGDKYIELTQGSNNDDALDEGDVIAYVRTGSDLDSLIDNLSIILDDVKGVTGALNGALGGEEGKGKLNRILQNTEDLTLNLKQAMEKTNEKIDSILINFNHFTENLNKITGENRNGIKNIVDNVDHFSSNLKNLMENNYGKLDKIIANLERVSHSLADDGPEITRNLKGILEENRENLRSSVEELDRSLENLKSITGKIDRGEGSIGKLVNDEATVESLNETLEGLNNYLTQADRIKLDLGFHTEYLQKQGEYKNYLHMNVRPVRDHYYQIEFVQDPRGKTEEKTTETSTTSGGSTTESSETKSENTDEFKITAQIAQRYYDTEFRIGLKESTFGLGIDQFFGRQDQLRFHLDAWDLGREYEGSHYKMGAIYRFLNNFYLYAGVDDFANEIPDYRDYYLGIGIIFNEDNLKMLASSLPISQATE